MKENSLKKLSLSSVTYTGLQYFYVSSLLQAPSRHINLAETVKAHKRFIGWIRSPRFNTHVPQNIQQEAIQWRQESYARTTTRSIFCLQLS